MEYGEVRWDNVDPKDAYKLMEKLTKVEVSGKGVISTVYDPSEKAVYLGMCGDSVDKALTDAESYGKDVVKKDKPDKSSKYDKSSDINAKCRCDRKK